MFRSLFTCQKQRGGGERGLRLPEFSVHHTEQAAPWRPASNSNSHMMSPPRSLPSSPVLALSISRLAVLAWTYVSCLGSDSLSA